MLPKPAEATANRAAAVVSTKHGAEPSKQITRTNCVICPIGASITSTATICPINGFGISTKEWKTKSYGSGLERLSADDAD